MCAVFTCLLAEPLIVFSRNMKRTRGSVRLTLCYFALVLMALITGGLQIITRKSNQLLGGLELVYDMLIDLLQP